jgi:peptidoglycan/xylan/chitin deacetylase (PgdA/CDA1 family)
MHGHRSRPPTWFAGAGLVLSAVALLSLGGTPAASNAVRPAPDGQPGASREIALTFDDLPASQGVDDLDHLRAITGGVLAALEAARAPAAAFVNEGKLDGEGRDARVAQLERWVRAGIPLGNHTASHLDLNTTPLDPYQEDILRGERTIRTLMRASRATRYFRHPYTHTGATPAVKEGLARFLREQGLVVAPFTVEHADYLFSDRFRKARLAGDAALARRIARAYLAHLDTMLDFFEALSRDTFGREIRQILLIHANDINAAHLPAMLDAMARRGYRFITLDRALEDPAYATPDAYVGRAGLSWLHRWRVAKGLPSKLTAEPDPPAWILK